MASALNMTAVSNHHDRIQRVIDGVDTAGARSRRSYWQEMMSSAPVPGEMISAKMCSAVMYSASMAGGGRRGPRQNPRGPGKDDDDGRTDLITKTRPKTKKPSLYKVVLLNDDYTPMEFVVDVLERFFSMGREDATQIMLHVHHKGKGICGVFTYEIAETKVTQVTEYARQNQHPLQCAMEKE